MSRFTKQASEVLISCAVAGFVSQATIAPAIAENRMSDIPRGNFARQIPTPQCDGFEDYMRDAAKHVVKGVEYLGEKAIKTTVGLGKTLAGNPHALIDEVNSTFEDMGKAAATLSKYTPLALISVIVDQLPPGGFTNFLKTGVKFQDQLRAGVATALIEGANPIKAAKIIYKDGSEVFGDIGKVLVNLDDPLAAGNEFLKLNQKWTGAGALTYMLTEKDPITGMKKALNAMHRQVELVTNHAGPNGKVAAAVLDYAMGESKKLIDKIPDGKSKQVAALLSATFATTFKTTLSDPNYRRNGYNVSRHPFYFADIRALPTEWMGDDHNSGGKYDWGMSRAKVEEHHGCISLGDYVYKGRNHTRELEAVCGVESGRDKWWSRPTDYKLVWGDNCSGGSHDRSVWQPVCKKGYVSVGFVAGRGSWKKPKANRIACVKNDPHLLTVVDGTTARLQFGANDANSGAKFDITAYQRNFEGLYLTHAVPVVKSPSDKRFINSLRIAVGVPGIAPSGKKSHCVNFYARQNFRGRTTQFCAHRPVVNKIENLGGPWGATHKNVSSIQCGRGVAGLFFYRHKLDRNPELVPCHDYALNSRHGDYKKYTHVKLMTRYIEPTNEKIEFVSPEEQERRWDLKASCDKLNTNSCLNLARSQITTIGWEKTYDAVKAVKNFGRACEENIEYSCQWYQRYANQLCKVVGTTKACAPSRDADRLIKLAILREGLPKQRAACQTGGSQSCLKLAEDLFAVGKAKSSEREESLKVFRKLCDANFSDSCARTKQVAGVMCVDDKSGAGCTTYGHFRIKDAPEGYVIPNRKASIKDFEKGCNYGDEEGCIEFVRKRIQIAYMKPISIENRLAVLEPVAAQSGKPANGVRALPNGLHTLSDSCDRGHAESCRLFKAYTGLLKEEQKSDYYLCHRLRESSACTAIAKADASSGNSGKPFSTDEGAGHLLRESCRGMVVTSAMLKSGANNGKRETKGDGEACFIIASKTLSGEDGTQPHRRELGSLGYFAAGCELDHAKSCLMVAKISRSPTVPASQRVYAPRAENKACDLGSQEGCAMVKKQQELKQTRLIPIEQRNQWGQRPGDGHQTTDTCFERDSDEGFVFEYSKWRATGLGAGIKTKFSNSGPDIIILNRRSNREAEENIASLSPGQTIEISENQMRWIVALGPDHKTCLGVVRLVQENQHFVYSSTGQAVHQINTGRHSGGIASTNGGNRSGTGQQTGQSGGQTPNTGVAPNQVAQLSPQSCSARGTAVSDANGVETKITFDNKSAEDLFVFWVGFDGQETNYEQINAPLIQVTPGNSQTFDAMTGFQFSVFDLQGNCLGIANLTGQNQTFAAVGSAPNLASGNGANTNPGGTQTTTADNSQNSSQPSADNTGQTPAEDEPKLLAVSGDGVTNGCEIRGQVTSQNGGQPTKTAFANFGADNLFLFWIDFNGQETDYTGVAQPLLMVEPGQIQRFDVQTGFAFSVFDQNSNCVGATTISQAEEEFGIAGQGGPVEASIRMVIAAELNRGQSPQNNQTSNQQQEQIADQDAVEPQTQQTAQDAGPCDLRGNVVSTSSGEIANTTIFNSGSGELEVFWIDFDGQETDYSGAANPLTIVAPGASQNIDANIGFAFSVFDQTGTCLGVAQIAQSTTEFTFAGNHFASDDNNVVPHDQTFDDTSNNDGFENEDSGQFADSSNGQDGFDDQSQTDLFGQNSSDFAGGCELRGQTASTSTGEAASAVLSNNSAVEIEVFWIDYSGLETDYDGIAQAMGSLEPGESETIDASIGFKFIGLDGDGNCIGIADITRSEIQVAFQ